MKGINKENNDSAAIGIGAMIVFIALILVAAVAAAVIIQTAEKLQQNAQKSGDDTSNEMQGKVLIMGGYLDDQANDNYVLFVRLAPGSDPVTTADIITQMYCGATEVIGLRSGASTGFLVDDMDDASAPAHIATMDVNKGYILSITGNAACNALDEIAVYVHVKGAGTTYEVLTIDDRTDGAAII